MSELGEMIRVPAARFERRLPGPIELVWQHLADPSMLPQWFEADSEIEGREGGRVRLNGGHIRGVVTQWRPPTRLAYTWDVFGPDEDISPYPESCLTLELEAIGDEVRLTLLHLPVLERFERQNAMGWATFLDILTDTLVGEPVQPRRAYMERNAAHYGVELANLAR